jgi:hypothetical protein
MYLRQTRHSNRGRIELDEQLLNRGTHVLSEHGVDVAVGRRLAFVLKWTHSSGPFDGEDGEGGDVLAEFDEDACSSARAGAGSRGMRCKVSSCDG